jgi:hypothetical protein
MSIAKLTDLNQLTNLPDDTTVIFIPDMSFGYDTSNLAVLKDIQAALNAKGIEALSIAGDPRYEDTVRNNLLPDHNPLLQNM